MNKNHSKLKLPIDDDHGRSKTGAVKKGMQHCKRRYFAGVV